MLKAFTELHEWLAERNLLEGVRVTIESPLAGAIVVHFKMDTQGYMIYDAALAQRRAGAGEIMGIPFEIKWAQPKV